MRDSLRPETRNLQGRKKPNYLDHHLSGTRITSGATAPAGFFVIPSTWFNDDARA